MHPAAKLLLALLPPPEKAVWYALFALALPLLLLALLFPGPAVLHERVPLATPGQARWYIDGAEACQPPAPRARQSMLKWRLKNRTNTGNSM